MHAHGINLQTDGTGMNALPDILMPHAITGPPLPSMEMRELVLRKLAADGKIRMYAH